MKTVLALSLVTGPTAVPRTAPPVSVESVPLSAAAVPIALSLPTGAPPAAIAIDLLMNGTPSPMKEPSEEELIRAGAWADGTGGASATATDPNDLSDAFLRIHQDVLTGRIQSLPVDVAPVRYIFIPGLFGNHVTNYMTFAIARLRALGLDVQKLAIDTEGDRRGNMRALTAAIAAAPGRVVLIGHSRGGLHAHDWYRRAPAEMKDKIRAVVLVQAPLAGSPIADKILKNPLARFLAGAVGVLPGWRNLRGVLRELRPAMRARLTARLPALSESDLKKFLDVSSAIVRDATAARDYAFWERLIRRTTGQRSDGMVPVTSPALPGARTVFFDGADHSDLMVQNPGWFRRLVGRRQNPRINASDAAETLIRLLESAGY
jgi:pimeloyl-ACP methyl ester carboxylesterase